MKKDKPIWKHRSEGVKAFLTGLGRKCTGFKNKKAYSRKEKHGRQE